MSLPPTQPQQPQGNRPPSSHRSRLPSMRSPRATPFVPAHAPEDIDIRGNRAPVSFSYRPFSPSASHRSIFLPPDGFIPTLGEDSTIALPPPHELNRPVTPVAESTHRNHVSRGDGAEPDGFPFPRARTASNVSRGSTRISQYDLLSRPDDQDDPEQYQKTPPEQIAADWRARNSNPVRSQSRTRSIYANDGENNVGRFHFICPFPSSFPHYHHHSSCLPFPVLKVTCSFPLGLASISTHNAKDPPPWSQKASRSRNAHAAVWRSTNGRNRTRIAIPDPNSVTSPSTA